LIDYDQAGPMEQKSAKAISKENKSFKNKILKQPVDWNNPVRATARTGVSGMPHGSPVKPPRAMPSTRLS